MEVLQQGPTPRGLERSCPQGSGLSRSSCDSCHPVPELGPCPQSWAPPGPGMPTAAPTGDPAEGKVLR